MDPIQTHFSIISRTRPRRRRIKTRWRQLNRVCKSKLRLRLRIRSSGRIKTRCCFDPSVLTQTHLHYFFSSYIHLNLFLYCMWIMNYRKSLNFQEKYYNVLSLVPISNFFFKKKKNFYWKLCIFIWNPI